MTGHRPPGSRHVSAMSHISIYEGRRGQKSVTVAGLGRKTIAEVFESVFSNI